MTPRELFTEMRSTHRAGLGELLGGQWLRTHSCCLLGACGSGINKNLGVVIVWIAH
jgi:hypothetical protein